MRCEECGAKDAQPARVVLPGKKVLHVSLCATCQGEMASEGSEASEKEDWKANVPTVKGSDDRGMRL